MDRNDKTEMISYKAFVDSIPSAAMMIVCNDKMEIIHSNQYMWKLFDCSTEEEFLEFCDSSYKNLIAPSDKNGMVSVIEEAKRIDYRGEHREAYRILTKNGMEKMIEDAGSIIDIFNDDGVLFNIFTEIGNRGSEETYDKLTTIYNKEQFFLYAERFLRQAEKAGMETQYSFAYSNICNFKYYNMKYGRRAGDLVLKDIVQRVKNEKTVLLIGRYSSDHFIFFSNEKKVPETIKRINGKLDKDYDGTSLKFKTGFYQVPRKGIDVELACDLAKIACDTIKDSATCFVEYNDELEKQLKMENYIDANFNNAVNNEYIKVFYQPVIRTISGAICGAEALARWIDPEIGFLSPGEFIPVLEKKHLITKLDLYMVRQVCKDLQKFIRERKPLFPISFNLSKLDFIECDIFEEIESLVMEYDVPRDLINIEITESIVTSDPDQMKKIIMKFQETGYQIWMDDFGSELSSLNILDEYNFDEIKLDMLFLRSFDERSREIIRSVVQMSKRLGVQTLAEGVETEEQLEYLKKIGCEKVQGFYFSRPVPMNELMQYQAKTQIPIESRAMRKYYDQIGKIDQMTDLAFALVEYDKKDFRFLFVNEAFAEVSKEIGNGEFVFTDYIMNAESSTLSRKFRSLQEQTKYGEGFKQMDYSIYGKYFRIRSKCISTYEDYEANLIEIENLTRGEEDEKREQLDYIFRIMYSMYDDIFILDDNSSFKNVQTNTMISQQVSQMHIQENSYVSREKICKRYLMWEDQKDFMDFTDPATLKARLKSKPRGYETRYFRNKIENGAYIWKANTIQYIPEMDMLIYSTRPAFFDNKKLLKKIIPSKMEREENEWDNVLWQTLIHSRTINMFWKDINRRFVGVNQKFLETFGYDSANILIGKTDEEMHWHVDDEMIRADEYKVLENGQTFVNRIGRCIIQGVLHNILITKEPLYKNGKIVGLIGYFIDLDSLNERYGNVEEIRMIDTATGLLSAYGMTNTITDYIETWTRQKESFAVIQVEFKEYERAYSSYGSVAVAHMATEVGNILKHIAGNNCSIARLYAGLFVLLKKYTDKDEVRQMIAEIQTSMRKVHTLAGFAATINPNIRVTYAEDEPDLQVLISMATGNTTVSNEDKMFNKAESLVYKNEENSLRSWKNSNTDILTDTEDSQEKKSYSIEKLIQEYEKIDQWVYVADTETYEVLYVNEALRNVYVKFFGLKNATLDSFVGKKCYEVLHHSAVPCSMCVFHRIHFEEFYCREFYDREQMGVLQLKDRLIDVNGRRCLLNITEHASVKEEGQRNDNSVFEDDSLLNDLLRKAMYEHEPSRSISILLEHMGRYLRAERAHIGELGESNHFSNTYEWCRYGVPLMKDSRQHTFVDIGAFWRGQMSHGASLTLSDIESIKTTAPSLYYQLKNTNIKSIISYPLWRDGKICGFYAFENPSPEAMKELYPILRTVGHFFESLMISRDLIDQLEEISYSDRMTGFGNRFAFDRYRDSVHSKQNLGIVMCDVNGLKQTNDMLGHLAGDELLLRAADSIVQIFGESDLFRIGGDEFLILVENISEEDFLKRVNKLRMTAVENEAPLAIGSEWKKNITDIELYYLIETVDQKMYEDKSQYYFQADKKENI